MTATAEPPLRAADPPGGAALNRAAGSELLGAVHGCGYRNGVALVRRADGQMVQLGALMYALLESVDGRRDTRELAAAVSERVGRQLGEVHVVRLAEKLSAQGLLAGSEHRAPPRRNPLLALRWKVLVTDPTWTRRLTRPFTVLFRPWLMVPILAAFGGVFWFVLIHKGVASATAQAFHSPGLLLLVFALAVISAGFHELGHAAACRYGGATPGGMGMGLYMVWPAFYTDVTDTYRLPKRARLRVDLAGLYFNAVVAVITMGVWLAWRSDALLLLVALQVLQMVKQLSPVIRADGYHILSDATGVPDLYSQMGPTLRRLLPGHRHEPSALTGRARLLVTVWVLIIVPVLLSLTLAAIILLPRLATSAWDSARHIIVAMPHQADHAQVLDVLASIVRLVALSLPVMGTCLVAQKVVRTTGGRAYAWSRGRPRRQAGALLVGVGVVALLAWAWWPAGQYQPVRSRQDGTLGGLVRLVSAPAAVARPAAAVPPVQLSPGTHLAVAMIPVGGATKLHPAVFVIAGRGGRAVEIVSRNSPDPGVAHPPATTGPASSSTSGAVPEAGTTPAASPTPAASTTSAASATSAAGASTTGGSGPAPGTTSTEGRGTTPTGALGSAPVQAAAFPFRLPAAPGPGGTQALAVNTTKGGVTYDVAYALVTVQHGAAVTETNSAYALADCQGCTTVAVSMQVVLVVGQSKDIAPINAAGALNYDCPACSTTAIADQLVITLKSRPSKALLAKLEADLQQLGALPALGAGGTPAAVAAQVAAVQQEIDTQLNDSGLPTSPITTTTPSATTSTTSSTTPTSTPAAGATSVTTTPGAQTTTASSTTPAGSTTTVPSSTTTVPSVAPTTSSASPSATTTTSTVGGTSTAPAG